MNAAPSESDPLQPFAGHDPYAAMRIRDFRRYVTGNMLAMLGAELQTVGVGWEIYVRTGSTMALAWVGLLQVIPIVLLVLPSGYCSDHYDRRKIIMASQYLAVSCSLGLLYLSITLGEIWAMYCCLFGVGVARAFQRPAKSSFVPQIVPRNLFSNAVTWNSSIFQLATIVGPAVGGLIIWAFKHPAWVYGTDTLLTSLNICLLATIPSRQIAAASERTSLKTLIAGVTFVFQTKIVLAALTLDMFAVLLGGAVTLLPVFAEDILKVGPSGFGWMRAAPGMGAICMSLFITHRPPLERAGRTMLWAVAGFGVATIIFGASRWFPLSLVMLFLVGAFDMISVVVRQTLVQLSTPDAMRGRVSAVNSMFIGLSNELGGFESGTVAYLFRSPTDKAFGTVASVIGGGVGTLLVVAFVALQWPQVRQYGRLDGSAPEK